MLSQMKDNYEQAGRNHKIEKKINDVVDKYN